MHIDILSTVLIHSYEKWGSMNFKGWLNWEESHSGVDIKLPTDYGKYSTPFDEILKVGYSLTTPASIFGGSDTCPLLRGCQ